MALTNREDIVIADEPDSFARALIELYQSEELWNRVSEKGSRRRGPNTRLKRREDSYPRLFGDGYLRASVPQEATPDSFDSERPAREDFHIAAPS